MSDLSSDGWDIPTSVSVKSNAPTAKKENVPCPSDKPMAFGTRGEKSAFETEKNLSAAPPISAVANVGKEEMAKPISEVKGFGSSSGMPSVASSTITFGFGSKPSESKGFGPPKEVSTGKVGGFGTPASAGTPSLAAPATSFVGFGSKPSESKGFGPPKEVSTGKVGGFGTAAGSSSNLDVAPKPDNEPRPFAAKSGFPSIGSKGLGSATPMTNSAGFGASNKTVVVDSKPINTQRSEQSTEAKGFGLSSRSTEFGTTAAVLGNKLDDNKGFGTSTEANGFGSKPSEKKGFGSSTNFSSSATQGFGSSSGSAGFGSKPSDKDTVALSEAKGFGTSTEANGFGSKPSEKKGFGSSTNFSSSATQGFGSSSGSAGFGSKPSDKDTGASSEPKGFGSAAFGSNVFGAPTTSDGFESKPAEKKGFGMATSFTSSVFGGSSSKGFGNESNEFSKTSGACFNCGNEGHSAKDCNEERKERPPMKCFNCGQEGHRSGDCSEPKKERGPLTCFKCKEVGHKNTDCTNEAVTAEGETARPKSTFVPEELTDNDLFTNHVEKGSMFDKFFDVDTKVSCSSGEKLQDTKISNFDEAGFTETVASNIRKSNYTRPTPVQQCAIPIIMAGHDVISVAQTGSGKTAAYLLPVIHSLIMANDLTPSDSVCKPRCIVVSPTRELCSQIHSESRKFCSGTALNTGCIYGGTSVEYAKSSISKGTTILVATVGRLQHFINEGYVSTEKVKFFILDEADTMLKNEHFAPALMEMIEKMPPAGERQTIMFSATFPAELQLLSSKILGKDYVMLNVDIIGCANKCITQEVVECVRSKKKDELLKLLNVDIEKYSTSKDNNVFKQKTIVFVESKKMTDLIGLQLCESGIPTLTIHGDRFQNQRAEAIREFTRGNIAVLVATAVAERGLDIKGVDHVINFDLPDEIDKYVHRIGRTGRVGNAGRATSFYDSEKDGLLANDLVKILNQAEQIVPTFLSADGENKCFSGPGTAGEEDEW